VRGIPHFSMAGDTSVHVSRLQLTLVPSIPSRHYRKDFIHLTTNRALLGSGS
jgi:hypothetical protein